MNDGIIKNNGTSRLMRATLPATYEEFKRACEAGTQPLDVLFNAAGWAQLPDFLNKGNLWADDTAALFGLGQNSVPDDGFKKIYEQSQTTNDKILRELILKLEDTPVKNGSVSFAIDFSDFDTTKYKSAIVYLEVYQSHNGGEVKVTSDKAMFCITGGREDRDDILFGFGPGGTTDYLVKTGAIELHFQFTNKVGDEQIDLIGHAFVSGKDFRASRSEFAGFYGYKIDNTDALGPYTFTNIADGGKAAFKHIEVFGERYV